MEQKVTKTRVAAGVMVGEVMVGEVIVDQIVMPLRLQRTQPNEVPNGNLMMV